MVATAFYRDAISLHRQKSKSHGELTATVMKTKELARDVQDAVEQDFTLHYRVTDTQRFLDKLLPVEATTVNTILQSMKDQNLYDSQTRRWMGFPDLTCRESESEKKKPQEKSLYDPFSAIAEAIQKVAETQRRSSVSKMGATKWVGYHSKSPKSQDTRAARLRPDALFALQTVADHTASNELQVEILF